VADTDRQILLHLGRDLRRVVDVADVYYLEATGQVTKVRLRSARELRDTRSLGEMVGVLGAFGIVRVHRNQVKSLFVCRSDRRAQGVGAPHGDTHAAATFSDPALRSDMSR
jgi:hypothetical protein